MMYWTANGEELTDEEVESRFDDFLDDLYQTYVTGSYSFLPHTIIRECDPIAYREDFNNWVDAEIKAHNLFESEEDYKEWTE